MKKFRWHRGGLDASMATTVEFETIDDLMTILSSVIDNVKISDISIKPYTYDDRIKWDTHMVLFKGTPVGFTNGPLE